MPDLLPINRRLSIPLDEIVVRASRSSGPGGQHANVTASRIEASFDVAASSTLDEAQKARVMARCGPRRARGRAGRAQPGAQPRARARAAGRAARPSARGPARAAADEADEGLAHAPPGRQAARLGAQEPARSRRAPTSSGRWSVVQLPATGGTQDPLAAAHAIAAIDDGAVASRPAVDDVVAPVARKIRSDAEAAVDAVAARIPRSGRRRRCCRAGDRRRRRRGCDPCPLPPHRQSTPPRPLMRSAPPLP